MSAPPPTTQPNKNRLEKISSFLDTIKKLFLNCLIIIVSIFLLVFIFNSYKIKRLVIYPIATSPNLQQRGYSGEILAIRLIEKVKQIESEGSSFYKSKEYILPSWDNKVDEISTAVSNSTSDLVKYFLNFLDKNEQIGNGEIISTTEGLRIGFRMNHLAPASAETINCDDFAIDSLLTSAAEYILRQVNPYVLACYYLNKEGDREKCLEIVQEIINSDNKENMGFATNLRAVAYMKEDPALAKRLFYDAIVSIKSPWISYNDLGVLYSNLRKDDSASFMFRRSIKINPDGFNTYLSYGDLMYRKYHDSNQRIFLDSAVRFYKMAIDRGKTFSSLYLRLLPTLYEEGMEAEGDDCFRKCMEMNPEDFQIHMQLGRLQLRFKHVPEALDAFSKAYAMCTDDNLRLDLEKFEDSIRKHNTVNK